MYVPDEAEKIIKKLQGPQLPVFLIVHARPEYRFEIVKGYRKMRESAAGVLPARVMYEAHMVLCISDETVPKCRSGLSLGYHGLLTESLHKFPDLREQLQEHFPYRDFK